MTGTAVVPEPHTNAWISEQKAKWLLTPILVIFAALLGYVAFHQMRHILHYVLLLGIDTYVFIGVLYYWLSRSYKDGVTIREVFLNTFWFIGITRQVIAAHRAGTKHVSGLHVDDETHRNRFLDKHIVPGTKSGVLVGIVVTVLSLIALPLMVAWNLFHIASALIWFVLAVWVLSDVIYFAFGRVWKNGVTRKELVLCFIGGPVAFLGLTYKSAKWIRSRAGRNAVVVPTMNG